MKLATTTSGFDRFFKTYQERIDSVCEAGFRYINLSMYKSTKNDELLISDRWEYNAETLLENTKRKGAEFVLAHSPDGNPLSEDLSHINELIRATKRAIDVCGVLGIPNIVVHAGCRMGISKEENFEMNKAFFEKLLYDMGKYILKTYDSFEE